MANPTEGNLTSRQHRQDEHRGLPEATTNRSGYMSAADKSFLESLRLLDLARGDTSTGTAGVYATVTALRQHAQTPHLAALPDAEQALWLAPGRALLPATAGATCATASGTYATYEALTFVNAALKYCWWQFAVPVEYNGGSIAATLFFLLGAATNKVINVSSGARPIVDGDVVDSGVGSTGINGTLAWNPASNGAGDLFVMSRTWSTTLPTAGGLVLFRFGRATTSDTVGEDVKLLGIKLEFPCTL